MKKVQTEEDVIETTQTEEDVATLERDSTIDAIARKSRESRDVTEEPIVEADNEEPEMVELKVDGQIILKPASEVAAKGGVTAYQMTLAADKRFKEAAAEKEDLARQRAELNRQRQELESVKMRPAPEPEISDDAINDFITNVYSGDEEKAKSSFKAVVSRLKQKEAQVIDPEAAVQEAMFKIEKRKAANDFAKNYSHLNEDPNLRNMVNQATIRIMGQDPNMPPSEVIVQAAEEIEQWLGTYRPQQDPMYEQVNRKKSIQSIKTAKARVPTESGYTPKTQAEIFAEVKASRSR